MRPKVSKADIAGWRVESDEQTLYFGEYVYLGCNEGVVYKDNHAFDTGEGVCYIPEYDFENSDENENELFEFDAKAAAAKELVNNHYVATKGYTRKDFDALVAGTKYSAYDLFMECEWQHPETLMDEWLEHDEEEYDETDFKELCLADK